LNPPSNTYPWEFGKSTGKKNPIIYEGLIKGLFLKRFRVDSG
jgi:hypothetical protein